MPDLKRSVTKIVIHAPIQKVWEAITRQDVPLPFFFGSVMQTTGLKPGAPIRMRTPDHQYTGVVGDILEVSPPHRFVHTLKFTQMDDPPCKVTYELKEVPEGTEFQLISEDIPAGTKTEKSMAQGSKFIVNTLKGLVETGQPPFGSRVLLGIIRLTAFMTPARCKSEHWPMDRKIR